MDREVKFDIEARNGLKEGIDELANAVKVTLGPKGRIVVFDNRYTGIHATKDGVTIAEEINPDTNIKKMGAKMLREAASKTAELAGDGTTTSTVLAQAMVKEGLKNVTSGANPMDIKRGMDKAMKSIISNLKSMAVVINNNNSKIKQVSSISANNDEEIGSLIAEMYAKVGNEGKITLEESRTADTYYDIVQGMQFDRGYLSPYFVTDTDSMQILYDDIHIVLCEDKISEISDVKTLIDYSVNNSQPILLICDDITSEVLAHLVLSKIRGKSKVVAIKSPYFGVKRKEALEDISILTGAYIISKAKGYSLNSFTKPMLGSAEKCIITKSDTVIVNGHGKEEVIEAHMELLAGQLEQINSSIEKSRIQERLALMGGGVAVLYVGAASEVEMKEKKDRVDDAIKATACAIEEGIVPGGGVALLKASYPMNLEVKDDELIGINIVTNACKAPIMQIATNSGVSGEVIVNKILENKENFYGYDFKEDKYVNMLDNGIIDPVKVTRIALENAISVAGIIIMTECALVNIGNQEEGLPDFLKN